MKVVTIDTGYKFQGHSEITDIEYKSGRLEITSQFTRETRTVRVLFQYVYGFRVLDEGDLLEFWPVCSTSSGWIFQIIEGGWFDQERLRTGFVSGYGREFNEYLITGINECVSIFSWAPPELYLDTLKDDT
ncbi:hypothetical protein [Undibacterium sp. Xuan67W]|uniref:hypothetical protein n=1 Tax=Undibacterium sp. Xuan67W TaxID=3413057 RepID=UPI003BF347AF